jgi:hypothetical protein
MTSILVLAGPFTPFWGKQVLEVLGFDPSLEGMSAHLGMAVVLALVGAIQIRVMRRVSANAHPS